MPHEYITMEDLIKQEKEVMEILEDKYNSKLTKYTKPLIMPEEYITMEDLIKQEKEVWMIINKVI